MISLYSYLFVSALLLGIGLFGVLARRNLLTVLMSTGVPATVIPSRTKAGVLGMALTIARAAGISPLICSMGIPAAIERTNFPPRQDETSAATCATTCGFTANTTASAHSAAG